MSAATAMNHGKKLPLHEIDVIQDAFDRIHRVATGQSREPYMRIPADPRRDADLILSSAIDELAQWRATHAPMDGGEELAALSRARDLLERLFYEALPTVAAGERATFLRQALDAFGAIDRACDRALRGDR